MLDLYRVTVADHREELPGDMALFRAALFTVLVTVDVLGCGCRRISGGTILNGHWRCGACRIVKGIGPQ